MALSKIKSKQLEENLELQGQATQLATGTQAERPSVPRKGDIRFNETLNRQEIYDGLKWDPINAQSLSIALNVALGG